MFSLFRQIRRWQLYLTAVLLSSNILTRIHNTILWLCGIQDSKGLIQTEAQDGKESTDGISPLLVVNRGSTATILRLKPGVVLKSPLVLEAHALAEDVKRSFIVEEKILGILGDHFRIMKFLGTSEVPKGLLFVEATGGNLQAYLDHHNASIDTALRMKWRTQAAEATQYTHQKGVIHSDLRPENYLLHADADGILNLHLCDFGGSTCGDIDGMHLPDSGFFNPRNPWVSTEATDIFSLGSIFYTIMTGHWPYKSPGPFTSAKERSRYGDRVDELFRQRKFPTVSNLAGGAIIRGCWDEEYTDAKTLVADQVQAEVLVANLGAEHNAGQSHKQLLIS